MAAVENDSISITAKDGITLEIARDVAKHSKTLADLLASTDETRQKESISLPQFRASTLGKVFAWCEEHAGADAAHKDFSMQANFANEYARRELTTWQADFFDRHGEHKWELAVAASYLDVTYLYYAACLFISKSLRERHWEEEKLSVCVDIHGDTDVGVEALYTAWNRCLSIDVDGSLNDPLPLLSKVYEIFASEGELSPLLVKAAVPLEVQLRDTLEQFAVNRGFSQTTAGGGCAYDKKRGNDWKIAIEYSDEKLAIEIKRVSE